MSTSGNHEGTKRPLSTADLAAAARRSNNAVRADAEDTDVVDATDVVGANHVVDANEEPVLNEDWVQQAAPNEHRDAAPNEHRAGSNDRPSAPYEQTAGPDDRVQSTGREAIQRESAQRERALRDDTSAGRTHRTRQTQLTAQADPHGRSAAGKANPTEADIATTDEADIATTDQPPSDAVARTDETLEPLFTPELAGSYRSRWASIQSGFVDDPKRAVRSGDELVAQIMTTLADSFAEERHRVEAQLDDSGDGSTEDLRVALRRYRSFFERLLSL